MRRLPNGSWVAIVLGGALAITIVWAYFADDISLYKTLKDPTATPSVATGTVPATTPGAGTPGAAPTVR
jgi:hypothetical protein